MKLGKPPLLEAYIRFDVAPEENAPPLDDARAGEFVKLFGDIVSPKDSMYRQDVQIAWKAGKPQNIGIRRLLETVRACNAEETRWIQVGRTYVAFNIVRRRTEHDYPGYRELKSKALEVFDRYVEFFSPRAVREVSVHYVDVIEIPKTPEPRLERYLALLPSVPQQGFGPVGRFSVSLFTEGKDPNEVLNVKLNRESDAGDQSFRLRMEWDAKRRNMDTLERPALEAHLDRLHDQVRACFRACFTDNGWQLFDPQE